MKGGDPAKLYELDGVEYDAKGVRELIAKLKRASEADASNPIADEDTPEGLLHTLLTQNWHVLRNLRVCTVYAF